jgi:hypothetical protein
MPETAHRYGKYTLQNDTIMNTLLAAALPLSPLCSIVELGGVETVPLSKRNWDRGKTLQSVHQYYTHSTCHVWLYVAVEKKSPWSLHFVTQC